MQTPLAPSRNRAFRPGRDEAQTAGLSGPPLQWRRPLSKCIAATRSSSFRLNCRHPSANDYGSYFISRDRARSYRVSSSDMETVMAKHRWIWWRFRFRLLGRSFGRGILEKVVGGGNRGLASSMVAEIPAMKRAETRRRVGVTERR